MDLMESFRDKPQRFWCLYHYSLSNHLKYTSGFDVWKPNLIFFQSTYRLSPKYININDLHKNCQLLHGVLNRFYQIDLHITCAILRQYSNSVHLLSSCNKNRLGLWGK